MEKKLPFPRENKSILKAIGPSIVSLGLGLGGGEFILWPFLVAHFGFGIIWGALIGITIQLVMILEIQRYTSVQGEDIVEGFGKANKYLPYWLILSTLVGFGWPGYAATSSTLIVELGHLSTDFIPYIALTVLIFCGLLLLAGKNIYKKVELVQKGVVIFSFSIILFIFTQYFSLSDLPLIFSGFLGNGDGYRWIPENFDLAVFIGAIAYSGAGGNLILGQSFYSIEEEHGLARYARKFLLWEKKESGKYEDVVAEEDNKSFLNFKALRRLQILEGTLLFWALGLITILMISYISFKTLSGNPNLSENFRFLITEANVIGDDLGQVWRGLFLAVGTGALISVQLGIYDLMGRISAVGIRAINPKRVVDHNKIYVIAIIIQMLMGIVIFLSGLREPFWLIVVGAVFNAFAMAVIALVVAILNSSRLPERYKPGIIISTILLTATIFYVTLFAQTLLG